MSFFKSRDNQEKHIDQIQEYLIPGEQLEQTYGLVIDFVALTDKRILFVDKSFVSKATAVVTIPYSKIEEIAIQKSGTLSFTNKVEITTKGGSHELSFVKGADVFGFYKKLTSKICD
ncbi:PH domain-containing protein [Desertibacillus haloalkaliphilus]|uniref:PH domain-containing protein n=1 Tax=Desertibacillus haloalkaliphilus TaxID=1328930 RepID=UPI001C27FC76|nr:PH domain-containing protein [Desertibacillus haloalkaliphilus]MBU8907653.1 PH domain-containing protein [Desertibacillus haloalkaliphilus]